ncbi:hypothetical protein TNCV_4677561 [Trichonephila clavipes]|nr:hypothetical protein TNCV_4677561 [Trichonephila clavipes]
MHGQCPSGSDTWCKYQKAKQEGKLYKHRTAGLPNAILNTVKPPIWIYVTNHFLKNVYTERPKMPMKVLMVFFGA